MWSAGGPIASSSGTVEWVSAGATFFAVLVAIWIALHQGHREARRQAFAALDETGRCIMVFRAAGASKFDPTLIASIANAVCNQFEGKLNIGDADVDLVRRWGWDPQSIESGDIHIVLEAKVFPALVERKRLLQRHWWSFG